MLESRTAVVAVSDRTDINATTGHTVKILAALVVIRREE